MPKDQDRKRLVRQRMDVTGERYTTARVAVLEEHAERDQERVRGWLADLAVPERAHVAFVALKALPPDERSAAALEGVRSESWRARRRCCQLLDDLQLSTDSMEALEACTTDEHPQVRRAALHSLGCDHCKPDGCAVDMVATYRRTLQDPSRVVRGGVVGVLGWKYTTPWAVELLEEVARNDRSQKLRRTAEEGLAYIARRLDADARRRKLPPDLLAKTERHPGKWIAVKDGQIIAAGKGAGDLATQRRADDVVYHAGDGTFRV